MCSRRAVLLWTATNFPSIALFILAAYGAPETPFGGVKDSGFGRVHGEAGLRAMCEVRHVNYDRIALKREPTWFPYSERTYTALQKAARLLFRRGSKVKQLLDLF